MTTLIRDITSPFFCLYNCKDILTNKRKELKNSKKKSEMYNIKTVYRKGCVT